MKANELRLSNLIKNELGSICEATAFDHHKVYAKNQDLDPSGKLYDVIYFDRIEGIPLTEEWLEKLGFKKVGGHYTFRIDEYAFLNIYLDTFRYEIFDTQAGESYKSWDNLVQSVHTLQNLVHALCGEELTIKK